MEALKESRTQGNKRQTRKDPPGTVEKRPCFQAPVTVLKCLTTAYRLSVISVCMLLCYEEIRRRQTDQAKFACRSFAAASIIHLLQVEELADIAERSGDVTALLQKRFLETLKVDSLDPAGVLMHSTWESQLIDIHEVLGVPSTSIPTTLQRAWVVMELHTVPASKHCEHNRPLVTGQILCSLFDSASTLLPTEIMRLTHFLDEHPLPQSWKLCSVCKEQPWSARAVNSEALEERMNSSVHMHRWAALSTEFQVEIPLVPVSLLPYQQVFETADKQKVYHDGNLPHSKSRAAHEEAGEGYSQRDTRHGQLGPFHFHAYFWLLAFLHQELEEKLCAKADKPISVPVRRKFATRMALLMDKSAWGSAVRESFSPHFQKVLKPTQLTRSMKHFLLARTDARRPECWGFQGLQQHEVDPCLLQLCASAVNTFAWLLPEVAVFKVGQAV